MVASLGRAWWCFLLCFPLVVGCDGCRLTNQPENESKLPEEQQPPFTSRAADAYPASRLDLRSSGIPNGSIKPGHWTSTRLSVRSNREDRRGVIQTRADLGLLASPETDNTTEITPELESASSFLTRRPAVLPQGQMRRLETRFLAPTHNNQTLDHVIFNGQFLGQESTARYDVLPARFAAMPPQTYFFVILTNRPERFVRWQTANWVRPVQGGRVRKRSSENYRIIIPPIDGVLPIAETALDWTSTAVLVWDDVSVNALTPGQQTAILDWLNFGGLVVVNGPAGVDSLTDTRFRDLLPIAPAGATELLIDDAQSFLHSHQVATDPSTADVIENLQSNPTPVAAAGDQRSGATEIGGGGLLVERRVGRGRLVQSRVDLMSNWLVRWKSYDSMLNSAILARPPRVFQLDTAAQSSLRSVTANGSPGQTADSSAAPSPNAPASDQATPWNAGLGASSPVRQTLVGVDVDAVAPEINTGLRLFSRDAKMRALPNGTATNGTSTNGDSPAVTASTDPASNSPLAAWQSDDVWPHPIGGLGVWRSDSDLLTWSQRQLRQEIGVTIPESALVFRSLLAYLFVLIPLNYLVFRMLGHLEWAWLAVFPLSIAGAFWVAHAAQLDVGFARSRNELALLEVPVDYSRAHLTRVVGLYNSLASRYRIDFATPDAAIDVIRSKHGNQQAANLFGEVDAALELGFDPGPSMDDISVGSNSYGVVHAEQIVDVDGPIEMQSTAPKGRLGSFDGASIVNGSSLELLDAFVVARDAEGRTRIAAMGTLSSGARKPIRLVASGEVRIPTDLPMGMTDAMGRLMLADAIPSGSARLVARLDQPLGGMTISPDCKQVRAQTLVLVHLAHRPRPPAVSDENLVGDVPHSR
ncbi:hypothetical protein [Allorhodopirellula solitaria]|uniref:Transmembrane protein n=1 Tax=Allorhodopirellula solitaria TaxID=2527987 RepID=A0A5C5XYU2_9BACT|nr:hypothetical protein [Allorhodopirellula solitaria]TWT66642.1 hypothetical protein CA85_27390 [Allorhodopirellula solitaria]